MSLLKYFLLAKLKKRIIPAFQLSSFLFKVLSSTWWFKGLLTFSGVLHTEGMKPLGTRVCFDFVWKPGDSRGRDCLPSPASLRHVTLFCPRTHAPTERAARPPQGCASQPMAGDACLSWRCWGGHAACRQRLAPTHLAGCHPGRLLATWLLLRMTWWLDWHNSKSPASETGLCASETPSELLLFVARSLPQSARLNMYLASQVSIGKYSATTVAHRQIFFHCLWDLKAQKSWTSFLINQSTQPSSSHCGLVDTRWGISVLFLKTTKNATWKQGRRPSYMGNSSFCALMLWRVQHCSTHPGPNPAKHFSMCFPSSYSFTLMPLCSTSTKVWS